MALPVRMILVEGRQRHPPVKLVRRLAVIGVATD
jgi:hypothetical protein